MRQSSVYILWEIYVQQNLWQGEGENIITIQQQSMTLGIKSTNKATGRVGGNYLIDKAIYEQNDSITLSPDKPTAEYVHRSL